MDVSSLVGKDASEYSIAEEGSLKVIMTRGQIKSRPNVCIKNYKQ